MVIIISGVCVWFCCGVATTILAISGGGSGSKGGTPTQCSFLRFFLFLFASIPHLFQVPNMLENARTNLSHFIFFKSLQSDRISSDFTGESSETHGGSMVPSIMWTIVDGQDEVQLCLTSKVMLSNSTMCFSYIIVGFICCYLFMVHSILPRLILSELVNYSSAI